jgi:hypothetical protein
MGLSSLFLQQKWWVKPLVDMVLPQARSGCLQLFITYCSWFFWSFVRRGSDKNWGYDKRSKFAGHGSVQFTKKKGVVV